MSPRTSNSSVSNDRHNSDVVYPSLDLDVFIEGNCFRSSSVDMFVKAGCTIIEEVKDADLVCFLGGEDINPVLYGEDPLRGTHFNTARDEREMETYGTALTNKIPMMGICRGMQFIHALNGGKLYQDVDNHCRPHMIEDVFSGQTIMSSSMHHQMCIFDDTLDMFAIAYAVEKTASRYQTQLVVLQDSKHRDLEAAVYPESLCIAFQGHPELGDLPEYTNWCLERVEEFLFGLEYQEEFVYTRNGLLGT